MKRNILIIFTIISVCSSVSAQINWIKYADNPVFIKGPAFYDLTAVGQPTVLFENDTIKMWYSAVGGDMKSRIGYAWSLDGVNWNKHIDMVLNTGYEGEWDSKWLDTPEIIKLDTCYLLYYYGDSIGYTTSLDGVTHSAIGMAYSYDGINWTKSLANPIFTKGDIGDWDGTWIESPAILYNESTDELQMWYNGSDTATWKIQIGLATSSNGINWTKHPSNPVLQNGDFGTYDDMWLGTPAVIYKNNYYEMWYSAAGSIDYNTTTFKFDTLRISYATSDDGINWEKNQHNPLFNTGSLPYNPSIDEGGPWAPDVIFDSDSNQYKMWFEANGGLLLAKSDTGFFSNIYENEVENSQLYISPNPANNVIKVIASDYTDAIIKLFELSGKQVFSSHFNSEMIIDVNNFQAGVYLIKIVSEKKEIVKKILVE